MIDDNAISTLIVDNEETSLRFIEVNNEKVYSCVRSILVFTKVMKYFKKFRTISGSV